ncbi:MAG: hypothetical protein ACRD4Y_14750, partial [Candidatus Acidiferrales bacterium]
MRPILVFVLMIFFPAARAATAQEAPPAPASANPPDAQPAEDWKLLKTTVAPLDWPQKQPPLPV